MVWIVAAVIAFVLGLIAESVTSWIAIVTARERHPELWKHSGSPTLGGNSGLTKSWPLVRYYMKSEYLTQLQRDGVDLPPVIDASALQFAQKLRRPLVYAFFFACVAALGVMLTLLVVGWFGCKSNAC
jgi:hypothetical protein